MSDSKKCPRIWEISINKNKNSEMKVIKGNLKTHKIKSAPFDIFIYDYIKINPIERFPIKETEIFHNENGNRHMYLKNGWMVLEILNQDSVHINYLPTGKNGFVKIIDPNESFEIVIERTRKSTIMHNKSIS